jgi:hypothetical protein
MQQLYRLLLWSQLKGDGPGAQMGAGLETEARIVAGTETVGVSNTD